jgi:hypothetical protein
MKTLSKTAIVLAGFVSVLIMCFFVFILNVTENAREFEMPIQKPDSPAKEFASSIEMGVLTDRGQNTSYLYRIAAEPERATNQELVRACCVLTIMDSRLKIGNNYEWMSRKIVDAAKMRFDSGHLFDDISINQIISEKRDQDRLQYDEFKFWIDEKGIQWKGCHPLK